MSELSGPPVTLSELTFRLAAFGGGCPCALMLGLSAPQVITSGFRTLVVSVGVSRRLSDSRQ